VQGGHTLPRKVTGKTPFTASHSKMLHYDLSPDTSRQVILNCRKNKITFGSAYHVLAQVALSRVLLRRYLRGEIDEAEWNFRKTEPMISGGPLNLRPFLDKDWFEAGGTNNFCLSISFYVYHLPFLPLGSASALRPGMEVPGYDALFSRERLVLRSKLVGLQANNFMKHPLFLEMAASSTPRRIERMRSPALQLRNEGGPPQNASDAIITPEDQATAGPVLVTVVSSLGDVILHPQFLK